MNNTENQSEIVLYTTTDGKIKIDTIVRVPNTIIGNNSTVNYSIIGENVIIGCDVKFQGGSPLKISVIGPEAVIPDGTIIPEGARLSAEDAEKGLSKMSRDVSRAIFAKLSSDGVTLSHEFFRTLKATYYRIALEFVELYKADAAMNGLSYDFHKEEEVIDLFVKNVYQSGMDYLNNPDTVPLMPSWKRVQSAFPGILEEFNQIVEDDNNIL